MIPKDHYCSFEVPSEIPFPRPAEIEGGVVLLLAAIVRDFWVVEQRETVFSAREVESGITRHRAASDKPRVVHLPRVHYRERPDAARL